MKEYTQTIPVGKVQLTKDDLSQLVSMIMHQPQIPDTSPSFTISARLADLEISEEHLDEFLHHTDFPPHLDNLSIQWLNRFSGMDQISHRLSLQLGPTSNQLQVSSTDQTWTLGKCEQLMRFLRSKTPLPIGLNRNTKILLSRPSSFWKKYNVGITLLLALLSLVVTIVLGVLQLLRK